MLWKMNELLPSSHVRRPSSAQAARGPSAELVSYWLED